MDVNDLSKLNTCEREFFTGAHNKCEWLKNIFRQYVKPSCPTKQSPSEQNQTISQWKRTVTFKRITSVRRFKRLLKHKVYVQPIGPFPAAFCQNGELFLELQDTIKRFLELYFPGFVVVFFPIIPHSKLMIRTRYHEKSKQFQLFLPDVNNYLKENIPSDAFCLCGFSWFDYFPSYDLNHILGEGSIDNGTVTFTFGHYSMFKEREIIQLEHWKEDFVMAKPFTISDSLQRDSSTSVTKDSTENCFDYITEDEKVEAKMFTTECRDEGCSNLHECNKKTNCASHSRMKSSIIFNPKVLFYPKKTALESTNCGLNQYSRKSSSEGAIEISINSMENKDEPALPPGCSFQLNCKILRRLFRVISHEICHVMGLAHCEYFSCTMNMSTSVLHTDTQPLFLCPMCLRKIHISLKFDLRERYTAMQKFLMLHTEVCASRGLHPEELRTMEKKQVLKEVDVCLFKNDLEMVMNILEVLEEREMAEFETLSENEVQY